MIRKVDMKTNSEKVREFTSGAYRSLTGSELPTKAIPMPSNQVTFLCKMVMDELLELLSTAGIRYKKVALETILSMCDERLDLDLDYSDEKTVECQMDAIVDIEYYMKDMAAKHGMNTDRIFDLVHEANLRKQGVNGKYVCREDGKIVKPEGWIPADLKPEVLRQMNEGSF